VTRLVRIKQQAAAYEPCRTKIGLNGQEVSTIDERLLPMQMKTVSLVSFIETV